jgi:hypothetical protein
LSLGVARSLEGGFAEGEYWFYLWIFGMVRYDKVNSPTDFLNGASERNARSRVSPGIQFLVRDNIKAEFECDYRWKQPDSSTKLFFRANGFTVGVDDMF